MKKKLGISSTLRKEMTHKRYSCRVLKLITNPTKGFKSYILIANISDVHINYIYVDLTNFLLM